MIERAKVNCAGCVACCKRGAIVLHPALGDDPRKFEDFIEPTPVGWVLKRKKDGSCIFLDEEDGKGFCKVWANAPGVCKAFDCREYVRAGFQDVPGCSDPEVAAEGRKRLNERT